MLVIPSIDLQQGQSIRLKQGDFKQVSVFDTPPMDLALKYASQGAKKLHVVDLDGAQKGSPQQLALIEELKNSGLSLQVGGGVRTLADATALLNIGVSQVVIGSLAVTAPELMMELCDALGPDRFILALDVKIEQGIPRPAIFGWQTDTQQSLWDLTAFYGQIGIRTILCTDIARDGMLQGPNFTLYEEAMKLFPTMHWQASGGVRNKNDLGSLAQLGLSAVIVGRALYEQNTEGWFQSW